MIDLNQFVKNLKAAKDVQEFVKSIAKDVVQRMLNEEMNQHLGYEKHASQGKKSGNSRNGYYFKKVNSTVGEVDLESLAIVMEFSNLR